MSINDVKSKLKNKLKNSTFFSDRFGFESGIDIANEHQVLYRKNIVIKNIILVVNLVYTLLFTIVSITEPSNWLLTALLFPVTFFVNQGLKKLIKKGPEDNMAQNIAMYVSCFYMFLSAVILYIKLKYGEAEYLKEGGYILIYISLAVCAYYQDKKMLKNVFAFLLVIITILHFTVTYPVVSEAGGTNVLEFFKVFFVSEAFRDIIVRTMLLGLFMAILYVNVSMTNYMQDERKKELMKRRQVQEDFTKVVTEIFDVTLDTKEYTEDEKHNLEILAQMTKKLSSYLGMKPKECNDVYEFTKLQSENKITFESDKDLNEEEKFEELHEQTELGSRLISRLQLDRKCDDIIRAVFDGANNDEFVARMRDIQNNSVSQIILICSLYVSMRSVKTYKKAYSHSATMGYLEEQFKIYFDPVIFDRFIRFSSDFKKIYDEEEEE